MKFLTIGDTHGNNKWLEIEDIKELVESEKPLKPRFDKYIFLGDYCDSFDLSNVEIMDNLKKIIDFKLKYPDNVILLLGNHDIQYYLSMDNRYRCSGFRVTMFFDLNDLFRKHKDLFQLCFQYNKHIWSHGGIHKGWFKYSFKGNDEQNIAEQINEAFEYRNGSLFDVGFIRGGSSKVGGILWADKTETISKPLEDYHQIVGHTPMKEGFKTYHKDVSTSITYCDCLDSKENFYYIVDL